MSIVLLYSFLVMLVSLVGVLFVWRGVGKYMERNLGLLVSFSAGVFAVIVYHLGAEIAEHASLMHALLWMAGGVLLSWLLFKVIPASHHHHDERHEQHAHSRIDARRILFADFFHNIADGILIAASFMANGALGAAVVVGVLVHELVQEVSEFFVLRQAGYATRRALAINFAISASILIGSVGGYFLLETFEAIETPLLGLASGALLSVIIQDLIPHSVRAAKEQGCYRYHIAWCLAGIVLMYCLNLAFGH